MLKVYGKVCVSVSVVCIEGVDQVAYRVSASSRVRFAPFNAVSWCSVSWDER